MNWNKMAAQNHIINFKGIVKNRLGPYKIVLKNQHGNYLSQFGRPITTILKAFDYAPFKTMCIFYDQKNFSGLSKDGYHYKSYLSMASGDIELQPEDFGPSALAEWEGPEW